ncbi:hypothetical protein [Roseibium algae]|uniref:Uncharacterized protein n=1 Tax=Roseibium algae TaxID=3123038 RepID=A0ABU8TLX6_9HYPH
MTTTPALMILLTSSSSETLTLKSCKVTGSSSASSLDLPKTINRGTYGGLGFPSSATPYNVEWTYTPDGGSTLLTFNTVLNGPTGLTVTPSETGKNASAWQLGEGPSLSKEGWLIRYYYAPKS